MKLTILAITSRRSSAAIRARATFVGWALLVLAANWWAAQGAEKVNVGIIGLDAHAVPWTKLIHAPGVTGPISTMRIVAAVQTPSADIPFSRDNNEANIAAMRELGVEIVDSIPAMLPKVDAVMVLSIDGRPHLDQSRPVIQAKKPLFIDKPIAASLADAMVIFRLARENNTPVFSNSSLRYGPATAAIRQNPQLGRVLGCDTFCSSKSILPDHPDLFYYGIHGCDMLFGLMGSGCQTVRALESSKAHFVIGTWEDGRLGTFRGILDGQAGYGAAAFCENGIVHAGKFEGYEPLLVEIAKFFQTGKAPVTVEETLEIYAFMEAADESARHGGVPVDIEWTLSKARTEAAKRQADVGRK